MVELEATLAEARAELGQAGGVTVPFPSGLDDRHSQQGLLGIYSDIFDSNGIPGDVLAIDCSEYPCVVQGVLDVEDDWESAWDAVRQALREKSDGGWFSCSSGVGRADEDAGFTFVVAHCGPGRLDADGRARLEARLRDVQRAR